MFDKHRVSVYYWELFRYRVSGYCAQVFAAAYNQVFPPPSWLSPCDGRGVTVCPSHRVVIIIPLPYTAPPPHYPPIPANHPAWILGVVLYHVDIQYLLALLLPWFIQLNKFERQTLTCSCTMCHRTNMISLNSLPPTINKVG